MIESLCPKTLGDVERVRVALRAGARPEMLYGRDNLTGRTLKPDLIVRAPDDDVLILMRYGRVTRLGMIWDELRSPCVILPEEPVLADSKGG